jgi:hypothetical protein
MNGVDIGILILEQRLVVLLVGGCAQQHAHVVEEVDVVRESVRGVGIIHLAVAVVVALEAGIPINQPYGLKVSAVTESVTMHLWAVREAALNLT